MKIEVSFADLTHTGKKIDATYMPYAVAGLASYLRANFASELDLKIFKYPHDFARYLEHGRPAVAAFSNYNWNEDISTQFAKAVKRVSPSTATVMGGPNYYYDGADQQRFLAARPAIDFYISGEGEMALLALFEALAEFDFDAERLKASGRKVPNTQYLIDGKLVTGAMLPRMTDLNSIPSPYLNGLMDPFFDEHLTPMVQTARGCPYSCTFCHDGLPYMTKYQRYDLQRIKSEIEYIKERRKTAMFCIVDDNFGIHKEDEAVAGLLADIRRATGWPNYINYGGTAKNNKERIVRISRDLEGAIEAGASVQSTDPDVLSSIKRANISTDTIADMARQIAGHGATSFSEIILCLPGDSREKHMQSVFDMLDLGIQDIKLFQFIVLPGTEGASRAHREKFGYQTKWRVFPRCIGHYEAGGEKFSAAEISEVCVANSTMPPEDYVECRKFDLTVGIFFNGGVFEELIRYLLIAGVKRSTFLARIFDYAKDRSTEMGEIYDWYIDNEAKSFFDTERDIREFLARPGTIDRYISGDLGINQMMHGRAMALSDKFGPIADFTFEIARNLLDENGTLDDIAELYLAELKELTLARKGDVFHVRPAREATFHFDFVKLASAGYQVDPTDHFQPDGIKLRIDHTESRKNDVRRFGEQFGTNIDGVSHFLQRSAVRNIYRDVSYLSATADA